MKRGDKKSKNPYAQALARLSVAAGGPSVGGRARAKKLSRKRRQEIARKAVLARWARARSKKAGPGS